MRSLRRPRRPLPRDQRDHRAQQRSEMHDMQLVGFDDLQARSAYQPVIHKQGDRWIAYIGAKNLGKAHLASGCSCGRSLSMSTNSRSFRCSHRAPASDGQVAVDRGAPVALATGTDSSAGTAMPARMLLSKSQEQRREATPPTPSSPLRRENGAGLAGFAVPGNSRGASAVFA